MPLNLEKGEPTEDPAIIEIKKKVLQLARDHSSMFHCGSGAEDAIRQAGLMPPQPRRLRINVTFTVAGHEDDPSETKMTFDEDELIDKTEEEQHVLVAEQLSQEVRIGEDVFEIPVTVVDLNLVQPPAGVPLGYVLRYTSNEGRVQHIVTDPGTTRSGRYTHYHGGRAMCGAETYTGWRETSTRGDGTVCKRCTERAQSRL